MRKKVIIFALISAICLSVACILWYEEMDTGDGFQKWKGDAGIKQDMGQGTVAETKQKAAKWVVTEDVQGSTMGSNLSVLGYCLLEVEEEDSLFAAGRDLYTGATLYGGENLPEQEDYSIYRRKGGIWEVFISHPPESVEWVAKHYYWDETTISNMVYHDGFLYYSLLYDDEPDMGGDKMQYICRIPVQGGEPEKLALAYNTFYIYNGKIYYMVLDSQKSEGWEYVYWEMDLDGTGRRALYRRQWKSTHISFTVGGGCLYVEEADGDGITGVNLETGDRKHYSACWTFIRQLYYENGYLYIVNEDYYSGCTILRVDAVWGKEEQLTDSCASAWLEGRYLYYTNYDSTVKRWTISILDLETEQMSVEVLEESEGANTRLQTVGDDLVVILSNRERDIYYRYGSNTLQLERLDRQEVPAENP